MVVGHVLYQTNPPTLGNNWICYHFVMRFSRGENGGDINTIRVNELGTGFFQTYELRSENAAQYFYS